MSTHAHAPRMGTIMAVASCAAIFLCVVAGPFGTGVLALPGRTLFWGVLIGLNAGKWWAWYRFIVPRMPEIGPVPGLAPPLLGAVLLNATLPLEIHWLYRAVGITVDTPWPGIYFIACIISASIVAIVAVSARPESGAAPVATAQAAPTGLAARADIQQLLAVVAEDHYVRLHLSSGERPLILYRFGDGLRDLAALNGLQIHRGAWVSARAVAGAERSGRRYRLKLTDGTRLPVSQNRVPAVRAKGWLRG